MMESDVQMWLIGSGLALGLAFGGVVQRSRFCMVAAVSNLVLLRDYRQAHAYLAALAVAIAGTTFLEVGGWVDIAATSYRSGHLSWVAPALGGLIFGFGSLLAGGCAGRTAVRAAEGNLGALITLLVFGVAAATIYVGILEPLRVWLTASTTFILDSGDASLASLLGLPFVLVSGVIVALCVIAIGWLGRSTRSVGLLAAGVSIGGLVVAGWWLTGYLTQDDFTTHGPSSLTFSGPLARSTLLVVTGNGGDQGFAVALVVGTLLGAGVTAVLTRSFRWTLPEVTHLPRLMVGGFLMGCGAILAGGCNIGQGLSGMSTVSVKALVAVSAIIVGMRFGLAWVEWADERGVAKFVGPPLATPDTVTS